MSSKIADRLFSGGTAGFYGCQAGDRGKGELVRLGWAGEEKAPRHLGIRECPACHNAHPRVTVSWRKPGGRDEDRVPMLVIGPEDL